MPRRIYTSLATTDHNIKMLSKIAPFIAKSVYLKLICDLISLLIFKRIQQTIGYLQAILMLYNMHSQYLILH